MNQRLKDIPHFDGGLFNDADVVPLEPAELQILAEAGRLDWGSVEPTIFGTLFERSLDPSLDPSCLSLDVTETAYIKALRERSVALHRLKGLGVGVSIDDFGVGYSSLSYLKQLPADILKIDHSFVRGVGEDVEDTAIVQMVIELAHTLGMKVVAEGVESEGQADVLKEMGCDLAQGFHFSRPLPPEDVPGFLAG